MSKKPAKTRIHGRYVLEERIAQGGNADVWRGRDEELDRPVAVKLLHPHLVPDERARQRLAAEGRLLASLTHPGIVQLYDVQVEGDTPALVMELIEGESLDVRLARDGALAPRAAAAIGSEVAEALAEAHSHGIIHRDVKPSNILLDHEGHAHLADFGIAHSLEPDAERLTQTGMVVGTPAYIAPEQLAGTEVGPRTDLFGLGAVLFEMLTGRPPYQAMAPLRLAEAHAAGPPNMPGTDPRLVELTQACLANAPADRPPDAGEVAAMLRAFPGMSPLEREAETIAMPVVAAPPEPPTPEQSPARRWGQGMRVATGMTVVFVAALLAVALLGSGKPAGLDAGTLPSSSPAPAWLAQLMADYADACDATLDPAEVAGLSQPDAEARVASLMDACGTTASDGAGSEKGSGKGKGHGKP
jgi:serine/threonine-protein kinase